MATPSSVIRVCAAVMLGATASLFSSSPATAAFSQATVYETNNLGSGTLFQTNTSPQAVDAVLTCKVHPTQSDALVRHLVTTFYLPGGDPVAFGNPGDEPLCGNWDNTTYPGAGVHRGNTFFLTSDRGATAASIQFGDPGDGPVVGDWNGDGTTDLGVHRGNTFYLLVGGSVTAYQFGDPGDIAIAGDFDGDGRATIGVRRGNTFYLTNDNASASHVLLFGDPTDAPLVGDWNGDGIDGVGIWRY